MGSRRRRLGLLIALLTWAVAGLATPAVAATPSPSPTPAATPRPAASATATPSAAPPVAATPAPASVQQATPTNAGYNPLAPGRILDTRVGVGHSGALGAGQTITLAVANQQGVPQTASGVALNVTVIGATAPGGSYLTVWPTQHSLPLASNLNFAPGMVVANFVVTALGPDGGIQIYNSAGSVQVIADVEGWYGASGGMVTPLVGARVLDTRTSIGGHNGRAAPGEVVTVPVLGRGNVPGAGVSAVVVNVTVTDTAGGGYVQAMPPGTTPGTSSTLNFGGGQTRANRAIVAVASGAIALYNNNASDDLIVDVVGWVGGSPGGASSLISPNRVLDTRNGTGVPAARVGARGAIRFQVAGTPGVPAGASAALLNLTVTNAGCPSYVTAYPGGMTLPFASDVNFVPGAPTPNVVLVKLAGDGTAAIYNNQCSVDLVADVLGYVTGAGEIGSAPGAPAITGTAGVGPRHMQISWSAPSTTGGEQITGYTIATAELGVIGAVDGSQTSTVVPVTCGSTFTFTVTAVNGTTSGPSATTSGSTPACYNVIGDVPYFRQIYSLSCEAAALQMALAHQGINVDQTTLVNNMSIDARPAYYDASGLRWGDAYTNFVGNVNGSEINLTGYGTYYSDVANVAWGHGASIIAAGENWNPLDVYSALLDGHPVVAWIAFDWNYHAPWSYLAFDGRRIPYAGAEEHAVTLVGVSPDSVYVYNPWSGAQWVSRSTFESAFATYHDMAVEFS